MQLKTKGTFPLEVFLLINSPMALAASSKRTYNEILKMYFLQIYSKELPENKTP